MSVFEALGGEPVFQQLVDAFYANVEQDAILRPLYPSELSEARRHLALFLMQYFGGPATYSQERGHPRLRMRHMPFSIGQAERDAWMLQMSRALEQTLGDRPERAEMQQYFEDAATFLMNRM